MHYDTIAEDLQRAKDILKSGGLTEFDIPQAMDPEIRKRWLETGGTIFSGDIYAARQILKSFIEEIERLHAYIKDVRDDLPPDLQARGYEILGEKL